MTVEPRSSGSPSTAAVVFTSAAALGNHQRRRASRRLLRQQTARHAMPQPDCSPIGAAALHTTVTMPAAASHHAMHIDLGRYSQRRRASRRPLRQQTARHAMTQRDCSPIGAAAVHTTVTLPAAANGRCPSAAAFAAAPPPLPAAPPASGLCCRQQPPHERCCIHCCAIARCGQQLLYERCCLRCCATAAISGSGPVLQLIAAARALLHSAPWRHASRRPLRQQTARHATEKHACSPK
jgi:hypothetical protein